MIRIKDNGYKRAIAAIPTAAGKVEVGVLGQQASAKHPNSKLTVGELAAVHEFGLGNVPERSFIRGFVDDEQQQVLFRIGELARRVAAGAMTPLEYRAAVNRLLVGGIRARMDEGIPPALLPETINRKEGPPVPLEDTLTLRDSVSARWSDR